MAALDYVQYTELVVAENHPSLSDVTNRPLKSVLTASGLATTVDPFPGFLALAGGTRAITAGGISLTAVAAGTNNFAVGTTVTTSVGIYVLGVITAGVSQLGIRVSHTSSATGTTAGYGILVVANTTASSFTQTNQYGMYVDVNTAGATSTVTNSYGIYVARQVAGGSANYGVRIAGGSTRGLLIDADGATITAGGLTVTAGNVGVGSAPIAATGIYVIGAILSGSTTQIGIDIGPTMSSAATVGGRALNVQLVTVAAAFTMTSGHSIYVDSPNIGAASAITSQYGVRILNQGAAGVTNAYGLHIAAQSGAATINYGIYVAGGTPAIYVAAGGVSIIAGNLGIGVAVSAAVGIEVGVAMTTSTSQYGITVSGSTTFSSASTTAGYGIFVGPTTAAAAFTMTNFYGIYIAATAKGAGSTITNRYGLYVVAPSDGATNNIGVYVNSSHISIYVTGTSVSTSTTKVSVFADTTFDSTTTSAGYGFRVDNTTAASAFTLTNMYGVYISAVAKGVGSTITNRYGLYIVAPSDGATLNVSAYVHATTAIPATAGAVAAGQPIRLYSNGVTIEWTTDAPTHTRVKGSLCFNINGSSTSTRGYINTDGAGTWASFTTSA